MKLGRTEMEKIVGEPRYGKAGLEMLQHSADSETLIDVYLCTNVYELNYMSLGERAESESGGSY